MILGFAMPIFRTMPLRRRPAGRSFAARFPGGSVSAAALALAVMLAAGSGLSARAASVRPVTIPLEQLGQQAPGGRPQSAGSTLATVNFVGDHHLLVTFPVRRLMKRLPDSEPEDDDRMIEAVLVDYPTGTVAARTTWRVHDGGQYLWDVGHGHFLLRIRDRLELIAPLANLSTEHPFEERRVLTFDRKIVGLLVSAEQDLLTVETASRAAIKAEQTHDSVSHADSLIEVNFYRIEGGPATLDAVDDGHVMTQVPIEVPMTRDGYLDVSQESRNRWLFDYIEHAGKKIELSPFETTCYPHAKFVSRSEFVAFGCNGSVDHVDIGGFNMRGEQMWQQNFFDSFAFSTFSFAPESGRFALGRSLTANPPSTLNGATPSDESLTGEDVQVLQTETGKQVFHISLTPVQRSGQNFALAPDGLELAVVRGPAIEIYRLPAPSPKDKLAATRALEVPLARASGPILLPTRSRISTAASRSPEDALPKPPAPDKPPAAPAASTPAPKPVENRIDVGDAPAAGEPRKPPTLYNPGEGPSPQ